MKKPLCLLIYITVLSIIAAGCAYHNKATADKITDNTVTSGKGANNSATSSPGTVSDELGPEAGRTASEGAVQTEPEDKAPTNWEHTAFENVNGFDGVSMSVKEGKASATGLTLVFENITDSKCIYGEYFILEKKIGESWYQVPVAFEGTYGFDDIGYILEPQGESESTSDWGWLYGSLEPGKYRIVKDILDFRETGDYDKYFLAAEFVL